VWCCGEQKTSLVARVTELQTVMEELVRKTQDKLEEMSAATEEKIGAVNGEKVKLQEIVKTVQADLKQTEAVQRQVNTYIYIHVHILMLIRWPGCATFVIADG
jgi:hypothetical protein